MKKIGVFCASSDKMEHIYYDSAYLLGKWIGESGRTLVYGGANCGMMEAVAKGTKEGGGTVYGVVPQRLIRERRVSEYIDITFHCNDLSDRKQYLVDESDVMIVLPGSVGTLDEAFCALASNTFGMHSKRVIFWNINGFYDLLFAFFERLEEQRVVNKPWKDMIDKVNTLEEIKAICEK